MTIVYKDGTIADQNEPIGFGGCTVTALAQAPQRVYEETPCMDVQDISTPPTPPPGAHPFSGAEETIGSPDRATGQPLPGAVTTALTED